MEEQERQITEGSIILLAVILYYMSGIQTDQESNTRGKDRYIDRYGRQYKTMVQSIRTNYC